MRSSGFIARAAESFRHLDFVIAAVEYRRHCFQIVHGHPGAVGAAAAGRAVARGGRNDESLVGRCLLQLVKDPLIRRDNECLLGHLTGCADDLRG